MRNFTLTALLFLSISHTATAQEKSIKDLVKVVCHAFNERDTSLLYPALIPKELYEQPDFTKFGSLTEEEKEEISHLNSYEFVSKVHITAFHNTILLYGDLDLEIDLNSIQYTEDKLPDSLKIEHDSWLINVNTGHEKYKWFLIGVKEQNGSFYSFAPMYTLKETKIGLNDRFGY